MADLLQLLAEDASACTKRFGSHIVIQNSPHKLSIKSGSTTVLDAQTPDGKKWTIQVLVNIIEENA